MREWYDVSHCRLMFKARTSISQVWYFVCIKCLSVTNWCEEAEETLRCLFQIQNDTACWKQGNKDAERVFRVQECNVRL